MPLVDAIIYEMHVGGFSRHPSADTQHPGTYRAVIEKIPYLQALGITHVELLPIMAFDVQDVPPKTASLGLANYWGYSTHSFFAPHPHYACEPARARDEFRDMVKALHRAGIGVILDVVFNHTAEGGADGPIINFRGIDNEIFYHLDFDDRSRYRDYTGCGNTVNCNHPLVTRYLDRLPALLGARHARGRLSLRPGQRHGPRRGRQTGASRARALVHRAVAGTRPRAHHRRGLGCRRAVSGRRLPRLSLGGMERPLSRRDPRASCAATGA